MINKIPSKNINSNQQLEQNHLACDTQTTTTPNKRKISETIISELLHENISKCEEILCAAGCMDPISTETSATLECSHIFHKREYAV